MQELAERLNQLDAPSTLISRRASRIRDAAHQLESDLKLLMEGCEACGLRLEPTQLDLQVMPTIFRLAETAPLDLVHLRGEQWHEPGVLQTLQAARKEAEELRSKRADLGRLFSLRRLPPKEEMAATLKTLMTQRGLFRFVSRRWRKARALHDSIRLKPVWRLKPEQRIQELDDLLSCVEGCEQFNRNAELRRLLGPRFKGIYTEFNKFEGLVEWYAKVESELRAHTRPGALDLPRWFVELSPDVLGWLASRGPASESAWTSVNELSNTLVSVFTREDKLPNLAVRRDQRLDEVAVGLFATSKDLMSIAEYLAAVFQTDESPQTASRLIDQLLALRLAYQDLDNNRPTCERLGDRYRGLVTDFEGQ